MNWAKQTLEDVPSMSQATLQREFASLRTVPGPHRPLTPSEERLWLVLEELLGITPSSLPQPGRPPVRGVNFTNLALSGHFTPQRIGT